MKKEIASVDNSETSESDDTAGEVRKKNMLWKNLSGKSLKIENKHNWKLEDCRGDDDHPKLKKLSLALADIDNGLNLGEEIGEEEKRKLAEELSRWEFDPTKQLQVFEDFNIKDGSTAELVLNTAREFDKNGEEKVSELVDVDEYDPKENAEENKLGEQLSEEAIEQIEEWYQKTDKELGENGPETKFFAALENVELPDSGRTIEEGEVVEMPAELEEEFETEVANDQLFATEMYECPECRERTRNSKFCPNPNCKRKKLNPLHPHTRAEIEKAILENYSILTVRETKIPYQRPVMYVYTNGSYQSKGVYGLIDEWVMQMRPECAPDFQSKARRNIATKTQIFQENLGAPGEKVVVENGILDLKELTEEEKSLDEIELEPHTPEVYATSKIHAEFDPDAECPMFTKLFERLVPDEAAQRAVQEVLGTALVSEKLHKKAVVLVGRTDTGKSTFAEIIREIFGRENTESESLSDLADTRWAAISLLGKAINICTEMSTDWINDLGKIKKMLAGEETKAEDKGESKIEITPFAEHLYCANQTPRASKEAEAFWNRFFVIEAGDRIPKENQDPKIKEKILENERAGILNWLIEGYVRFARDHPEIDEDNANKFTVEQKWSDARDLWLGWGDSIQRFIQQCIRKDSNGMISSKELYEEFYIDFCNERERLEPQSQKALTKRIKRMVGYAEHGRYRFEGDQKSGFKNIAVTRGKSVQNEWGSSTIFAKSNKKKEEKVMQKSKETPTHSAQSKYEAAKEFDYDGKIFDEGEEIVPGEDMPRNKLREGVEKGFVKKLEASGGGGGEEDDRSLAQKDKVRRLYEIVRELQDEHELGVLLSAVKSEAEAEAISPGFVDEFVEMEKEKGRILTHEDGEYVEVVDH